VPDEPVLSKKSGLLFERRLIERYIEVGTSVSDLAVIFLFELGVFFLRDVYVVVAGADAGPWEVPGHQGRPLHGRYRAGEDQQGMDSLVCY
jgi:hypothetical protein